MPISFKVDVLVSNTGMSGTPYKMKRIGLPEDVAGVALFLASRDSDYVTGQAVNVCGGVTFQ